MVDLCGRHGGEVPRSPFKKGRAAQLQECGQHVVPSCQLLWGLPWGRKPPFPQGHALPGAAPLVTVIWGTHTLHSSLGGTTRWGDARSRAPAGFLMFQGPASSAQSCFLSLPFSGVDPQETSCSPNSVSASAPGKLNL